MIPNATDASSNVRTSLTHWDVLAIALPIIFSNATVPLIGFADATVVGQLGKAHLLGATALASNLFSFIYYVFVFLRMGTTGLTAQAAGAGDRDEIAANLCRAMLAAVVLGGALVTLQYPIRETALALFGPTERVADVARSYFDIRIWAAPAGLANFALIGWFIGLGRASITFYLQLLMNGLNIAFAVLFVIVFAWGVPGVGLAALLAEYIAAAAGIWVAIAELRRRNAWINRTAMFDVSKLRRLFGVSRDILIRTFCLQASMAFFFAQGARSGDLTLAANAVLHSLMLITVYMIDGFAFAAETLVGQAIGGRQRAMFRAAIRLATLWAFGLSIALSIVLFVGGGALIDFVTTNPDVRETARVYLYWAALMPVTSIWCFLLDGIYIGATFTATMRNMMLLATAAYFAAWLVLSPLFGNHGLWMALHVLFLARAIALGWHLPALERESFRDDRATAPRPVPAANIS
jgi:MATE family, multidrug efflux pump